MYPDSTFFIDKPEDIVYNKDADSSKTWFSTGCVLGRPPRRLESKTVSAPTAGTVFFYLLHDPNVWVHDVPNEISEQTGGHPD